MSIFLDLIQFIMSSLMFSITIFTLFLYIRTKDKSIGRTLGLVSSISIIFLTSYSYSYFSKLDMNDFLDAAGIHRLEVFSYLFSIAMIFIIAFSIIAASLYAISIFPIEKNRKELGLKVIFPVIILFIISSNFLVSISNRDVLGDGINNVLRYIFPVGSLFPFCLCVVLMIFYKKITEKKDIFLARNFIIAFSLQIVYTTLDLTIPLDITFQFTQISYLVFSLLSFFSISTHYFKKYESTDGIDFNYETILYKQYQISERELEVINLLILGNTNIYIAKELYISVNTVKSHVKNIYRKLSVSNRLQLVNKVKELSNNTSITQKG